MRLMRSSLSADELTLERWDQLANRLRANKGKLGDLGGGNHFVDALAPYDDGPLHFLVHTGSRNESGLVDQFVEDAQAFDREFARVVAWAADNRGAIHHDVDAVFGTTELILDLPHNTYEPLENERVVIRKGSVHVRPGELSIIPSHMTGDSVLVRATDRVNGILSSISHGTGRRMSRSECKPLADNFDFQTLRRNVLIPTGVEDASLRTEGPYAYRELDDCLALISDYVEVVARFAVVAYMGHL
jgi:RNA-splicing ligase RtcB